MKIKHTKLAAKAAVMGAIILAANLSAHASVDFKQLGGVILQQMTTNTLNLGADFEGNYVHIAYQCKDSADNAGLKAKLISEFSTDPELAALNYSTNKTGLDNAAGDIANVLFPPPPAPTAADTLSDIIHSNLLVCPGIDTNMVNGSYKHIAAECAGITDCVKLEEKLHTIFSTEEELSWMNYDQNPDSLQHAIVDIATAAYPSHNGDNAINPPKMPIINTNGIANWRVNLSSGAEFLNPFYISVTPGSKFGVLTNAGSSTVAYIQIDVMRRWVLSPYSLDNDDYGNRFPSIIGFFRDHNWDDLTPDFQFDLGFLLGNSVSSTNKTYSAQTLAGSDIYADLGLGLPLWRNDWKNDGGVAVQVSLYGSAGVTTESSFEKIHANEFIGAAMEAGLPSGLFNNTNVLTPGLVEAKLGYGHFDYPSLTGTSNEVVLDGSGNPEFKDRWAPEMGVNMLIPFGSVLYLNVDANAYFINNDANHSPDQWDVKVGVTVPWTSVQTMLPFIK